MAKPNDTTARLPRLIEEIYEASNKANCLVIVTANSEGAVGCAIRDTVNMALDFLREADAKQEEYASIRERAGVERTRDEARLQKASVSAASLLQLALKGMDVNGEPIEGVDVLSLVRLAEEALEDLPGGFPNFLEPGREGDDPAAPDKAGEPSENERPTLEQIRQGLERVNSLTVMGFHVFGQDQPPTLEQDKYDLYRQAAERLAPVYDEITCIKWPDGFRESHDKDVTAFEGLAMQACDFYALLARQAGVATSGEIESICVLAMNLSGRLLEMLDELCALLEEEGQQ